MCAVRLAFLLRQILPLRYATVSINRWVSTAISTLRARVSEILVLPLFVLSTLSLGLGPVRCLRPSAFLLLTLIPCMRLSVVCTQS